MKSYIELALARVDNYQSVEPQRGNGLHIANHEETFNVISLNGGSLVLPDFHEGAEHLQTEIPKVDTLVVRIIDADGRILEADLCKESHLNWVNAHGKQIDTANLPVAEALAESIFHMMEDALLRDSLTFEDLEEGLHYYVGVIHHANMADKEVKHFLLKRLYKALRSGQLRRLYARLRALS